MRRLEATFSTFALPTPTCVHLEVFFSEALTASAVALTARSKNLRSSDVGPLAPWRSFSAPVSAKGALWGWTHWTATRSAVVLAALASACLQARCASLRSPHQSTAHSTTGADGPSRTTPVADSLSSVARTGSIHPPH